MNDELNILYTVDDSYLGLAAVSIESIISNNSNKSIAFFVCTEKDDKTSNFIKLKAHYKENKKVKFIHLDAKKYDAEFKKT